MQLLFTNRKPFHLRIVREQNKNGLTLVQAYRKRFFCFYTFIHASVFTNEDINYGIIRWASAGESIRTCLRNTICDRIGYPRSKTAITVWYYKSFNVKISNYVKSVLAREQR